MGNLIDLTGKRFHRLVVISRAVNHGKDARWNCQCDCGNTSIVQSNNLKSGNSKSCGCLNIDNITVHGCSGKKITSEYIAWDNMKSRCYNPNNPRYKHYGERGIKICDRWLGKNGFQHFIEDMGAKPSAEYSIDRIDNDGDYEPSNCRWATIKQQRNNQRVHPNSILIKGEPLRSYCKRNNISFHTMYNRIKICGWSIEKAISTPIQKKDDGNSQ
jgi:hypothetical protein